MTTYLLIQVFQLAFGQLELCNLRQHYIPAAMVDVRDQVLHTVNCVQRRVALFLQAQ